MLRDEAAPKAPRKLRCYLYTRVSTQMQVDGYSLDAQRELLLWKTKDKEKEMTVAAEFSDEGKSGKKYHGPPRVHGNDAAYSERQSGRCGLCLGIQAVPVRAERR